MCGEHFTYRDGLTTLQGSSPHVRGALCLVFCVVGCVGIIPACAGSTTKPGGGQTGGGDHPRMCGEHDFGDVFED